MDWSYLRIIFLLGLIAPGFGMTGCKPANDPAKIKTLDNFTSSTKTVNVCFGNFEKTTIMPKIEVASSVTIDKKREGVYRDATLLALSAVPDSIKSIFSAQKGAVIRLTDKVSDICSQKLSRIDQAWASEGGKLSSCWESTPENLAIYLDASPTAIQHHLVRTLARISSEVVATAIEQGKVLAGPSKESLERVKNFRAFQRELSDALMIDVANARAAGSKANLDAYADLILSDDEKVRSIFDNFVFAESFDSYYCNSEKGGTRERFQKSFPSSFEVFKKITTHIETDPQLIDRLKKTGSTEGVSSDSNFDLAFRDWFSANWWFGNQQAAEGAQRTFSAGQRRAQIMQEMSMPNYRRNGSELRQVTSEGFKGIAQTADALAPRIVAPIPGAGRGAALAKDGIRGLVVSEATGRAGKAVGNAAPPLLKIPVESATKNTTRGIVGRTWDWFFGAPKAP